ncbi:MAG: hypothetical protein DCC75_04155 [Proteobacteria bacterium]|nr:MAG: hypothetical protein DCC75_04155 [Pseudomonadota bacterium]
MSNNSSTFDSIDKLLVRALDGDSRQSFNALERKLGIPAETIRYRIKGMLDSGVISHFITIINIGKLGISVHKVLLKLHNVDESRIQRIIERLKSHKMVNWVARLDGVFDIAFTIWIQGLRELSDFVDELKSSNRSYISRLCFAVNIDVEFFTREYTAKHRRSGQEITKFEAPRHPAKIDKTDLLIMRQICMDVRAATAELARKVGVAPETVAARLRRLRDAQLLCVHIS